jgi:hypothetical protein
MRSAKTAMFGMMISLTLMASSLFCLPASAEGGFADAAGADRSAPGGTTSATQRSAGYAAEITLYAAGDFFELTSTAGALGLAGKAASGAGSWVTTSVSTSGGTTSVNSTSLTTSYTKGFNSISKTKAIGRTIIVNGQAYVVAEEVAIAVARATKFGATAAVSVDASVSGNGHFTSQIATNKGVSR